MKITVEGRTVVRIVTHNRQYDADRSRDITMRQRRDERERTEGRKGKTNQRNREEKEVIKT